ncbi:hypothetical protein [Nocardiopsis suaedae]|uniref:Uncharacterized protein n=1 Tax=Nocardiopsis suaedae TaxID=3018444 RepID=A0ABT4THQ7_9ACTN|nr:hypothetical protein [Nocardiopsis suaedae]MDA2804242.1 hypothetical protein [Nocardiopsis suaedae]
MVIRGIFGAALAAVALAAAPGAAAASDGAVAVTCSRMADFFIPMKECLDRCADEQDAPAVKVTECVDEGGETFTCDCEAL